MKIDPGWFDGRISGDHTESWIMKLPFQPMGNLRQSLESAFSPAGNEESVGRIAGQVP
jgi:hypothetical protein